MSLFEALVTCFLFIDIGLLIGAYYTNRTKIFAICEVLGGLIIVIYGIVYSLVGIIVAGSALLLYGIIWVWAAWNN